VKSMVIAVLLLFLMPNVGAAFVPGVNEASEPIEPKSPKEAADEELQTIVIPQLPPIGPKPEPPEEVTLTAIYRDGQIKAYNIAQSDGPKAGGVSLSPAEMAFVTACYEFLKSFEYEGNGSMGCRMVDRL